MNERIRELAEQAKIYFREVEFSGEVLSDGEVDFEDLEKFAELIVRECARWLGNREFASPEALKQHFGVE